MDQIVFQYNYEDRLKMSRIKLIMIILLTFIVIVLFIEARLVLLPTMEKEKLDILLQNEKVLKLKNEELFTVNYELKTSEEEIRVINKDLVIASNALKESNYKLIIAKEKAEKNEKNLTMHRSYHK